MTAIQVLQSLHAMGAGVSVTREGRIRIEPRFEPLTDAMRAAVRYHRDGLKRLLDPHQSPTESVDDGTFASFASPAAQGALAPTIPKAWIAGLTRLAFMPPPVGFTLPRWRRATGVAWELALTHGGGAAGLGWTACDLFGVHAEAPAARYDCMGLVFLLREGAQIVDFSVEAAVMVACRGTTHTFFRTTVAPSSTPAWDLEPNPEYHDRWREAA